jgi:hypothetical protein
MTSALGMTNVALRISNEESGIEGRASSMIIKAMLYCCPKSTGRPLFPPLLHKSNLGRFSFRKPVVFYLGVS